MSYKLYDAEIEYLENSTGKEAIDTGIYGTNTTQVSFETMFFNTEVPDYTGGDAFASGVIEWGKTQKVLGITYNSNNGYLYSWLGNNYKTTQLNLLTGIKHTVTYSSKGTWIDGVKKQNGWYNNSFQTPYTISAMTTRGAVNGNFGGSLKARLYNFSISDNGVLVRDLIPVRVGNVGYMYDRVSGQLFGNSGTGSFVLGPDVSYDVPEANEVAFLESWGNQYIDTGIKPSTDTKIELKCLYCKSGAGLTSYGALIGADDRDNAYSLNHSAVANFTYGLEFSNNFANPQTRLLTFDSTARPHNMRVYDEGGSLVTTLTCMKGVFEVNQNLYLFAVNRNGTPVYGSNRILYCKIYDGNTLVRDYVPVEYNGIGYMYDKVSGLFFDNQGTGKFLFGSIAKACARSYTRRQLMAEHSGYERLSYISNEGHTAGGVFPYINLGIKITPTMRLYTDVQVISKGTSDIIHGVYSPTPRILFSAVWNPARSGYRYPAQANSVGYTPESAYATTRAQLTLDKDTYTVVRGGSTFTSTVTAGDNFKTNTNFCLFFAMGYQLGWSVDAIRMWSFKIWDNDVLIMDLVPVMDKGTKKIGLLNIVNHRFYGPARGTFVGA